MPQSQVRQVTVWWPNPADALPILADPHEFFEAAPEAWQSIQEALAAVPAAEFARQGVVGIQLTIEVRDPKGEPFPSALALFRQALPSLRETGQPIVLQNRLAGVLLRLELQPDAPNPPMDVRGRANSDDVPETSPNQSMETRRNTAVDETSRVEAAGERWTAGERSTPSSGRTQERDQKTEATTNPDYQERWRRLRRALDLETRRRRTQLDRMEAVLKEILARLSTIENAIEKPEQSLRRRGEDSSGAIPAVQGEVAEEISHGLPADTALLPEGVNRDRPSPIKEGVTSLQRQVLESLRALPPEARGEGERVLRVLDGQPLTESLAKSLAGVLREKRWGVACSTCNAPASLVWMTDVRYLQNGHAHFSHAGAGPDRKYVNHGSVTVMRRACCWFVGGKLWMASGCLRYAWISMDGGKVDLACAGFRRIVHKEGWRWISRI